MNDLPKRLVVGLLGILLFLFSLKFKAVFVSMIYMISFFMMKEYFNILKLRGISSFFKITATLNFSILSVSLLLVDYLRKTGVDANISFVFLLILAASFILLATYQIFRIGVHNILENLATSSMALLYISIPLSLSFFLYDLHYHSKYAHFYLLFPLIIVWSTDTLAYFLGSAFGKKKIAPKVSPNKSYMGTFGSVVATTCLFLIMRIFWGEMPLSYLQILIFTPILAFVGHLGDFTESALKRHAGIKDSSNLLPGHGGFLDRFDSLLFVIPVYCILLKSVGTL